MALRGLTVSFSGPLKHDKEELKRQLEALGATYSADYTRACEILVNESPGSAKYNAALIRRTPIVRSDWIVECFKAKAKLPVDKFRLPPFEGCLICVSGLSLGLYTCTPQHTSLFARGHAAEERNTVRAQVEANGGRYSPELSREVTHLIAKVRSVRYGSIPPPPRSPLFPFASSPSPCFFAHLHHRVSLLQKFGGTKCEYANTWHIPIVHPDWLQACLTKYRGPRAPSTRCLASCPACADLLHWSHVSCGDRCRVQVA